MRRRETSKLSCAAARHSRGIREQFNPFHFEHNPRGPKFEVTTNKPNNDKGIKGQPGGREGAQRGEGGCQIAQFKITDRY